MNRRVILILCAAVVVLAAVAAVRHHQRPEARLRRQIRRLAARMEKAGPESALAAAGRAREISDHFTQEPRFDIPMLPHVPHRRSELTTGVFQARAMVDSLRIRIHDLRVDLSADATAARMTLSVTVTARMGGGDTERASRAFEVDWELESDGWRIDAVREQRVFRHLPAN